MNLRQLTIEDAPLMFEWMHDEGIVKNFRTDFLSLTMEDAQKFILDSVNTSNDIHLAISSDIGEYMGTVSLKNVDYDNNHAELSVVVRKSAMKRGYAWFGIETIINKAFEEIGLESIYWCLSRENEREIRFFDKHNFHEVVDVPQKLLDRYATETNLKWYSILKGTFLDDRKTVSDCKIIHIDTVPTVESGELSFFEAMKDIPFEIRRIYYISKVPEGVRRGFHAHKSLKQILFCPYGRIQIILENEKGREEIELSDPTLGIMIDKTIWREMLWLQKDSVLCVAASDYYNPDDYIRDYEEFKKYIREKK